MRIQGSSVLLSRATQLSGRAEPAAAAGHDVRPRDSSASNPGQNATAPDGTLWSLLSPEEQEFFSRLQLQGPLTYGQALAGGQPEPPRGTRLDVRA
jgi:hypothetical protein